MQSGYLSFRESTIHYLKHGSGKKVLICFHGYGESASNFNFLAARLENEFFLIALDLPFHGETNWVNGTFDEKILAAIVHEILKKENLHACGIHLLGFSLGGRLALALFEEMPQLVERLVLLAPDGLKLNFWYWLSTQTWLGNKCFKWTMTSPGWFLGLLRVGNRVQLINRSIYKFVEYYIHDAQVRQELYHRWTTMRKCKPSLSKIRTKIKEYNLPVRLLYGKHDRIILASPALRFIQDLKNANISMLECGHQVLHAKNADNIVDALIN
jgi:pimeloyl-ACP methyl ester carboxylesterase